MESFELTSEQLDHIKGLISDGDKVSIQDYFDKIHFADIAEIAKHLPTEDAVLLIKSLSGEKVLDVLTELDDSLRAKVLEVFSATELAKGLNELDTDDAADIIAKLPQGIKMAVINAIEDADHAEDIVELLGYEENSAGGLMAKELVSVNENWTVNYALDQIKKQAEEVTRIHTIYVVDDRNKLKGRLSIKDFLTTPGDTSIKAIAITQVTSVLVSEKSEEIAEIMSKYDLEAIPVTDELGKLVGRITIDDIVDVIKEEADKDYQLAAGITQDVEHTDSLVRLSRARLPWLLIGTFGGLGAATIINGFQTIISEFPLLMIFVPLIQSTGGNVGVQSSAIMVQAIANKTIRNDIVKRLLKESMLGLVNGLTVTGAVLLASHVLFDIPAITAMVVGTALITVVINAGILGTFVPFFLNKRKIDPALATGPFVTTGADILGILIYFFIAKTILNI